jgi:RNA polymerase sigma-70 factor (ECF subfamily)
LAESFELTLPAQLDSEEQEVRRAKARDEATWTLWYDRYFPTLYRYALARTARRDEAEDIAAAAFMRALEGIDRYDWRGRPVLAWLYRITHNLVADRNRRSRRKPAVPLDEVAPGDLSGMDPDLPRVELHDALARLKDEQRDVIILRFLSALSLRETATIMNKSEAAVYSLQVRALANLRKAIKE